MGGYIPPGYAIESNVSAPGVLSSRLPKNETQQHAAKSAYLLIFAHNLVDLQRASAAVGTEVVGVESAAEVVGRGGVGHKFSAKMEPRPAEIR